MPVVGNNVIFKSGLKSAYAALVSKDPSTLYFCTDTQQIYLGDQEYSKSLGTLSGTPGVSTPGVVGNLYYYNGNLYACTNFDGTDYTWIRVANVSDSGGTVTSVSIGEGLTEPSGGDNPITSTGTIQHAIPTGAAAHTSTAPASQTLDFGDTFTVETSSTDKFGHVVGLVTTTLTMPAAPTSTTYTLSSTSEGTLTLTPSSGTAQTVNIDGWSDLAKKSELASVFDYKGSVATVADLPAVAKVGDVYHVNADDTEYVCIVASTTDPAADAEYELLGTTVDLSGYVQKVSGATAGDVATLAADGSIVDSGKTIGTSVPADAVFTDTTYDPATASEDGLMTSAQFTKLAGIEAGAEANVLEGVQVNGTDLTIDANKKVNITLASFGINDTTAVEIDQLHGKLTTDSGTGVLTLTGNVTGSANSATTDASGNVITTTYATKSELPKWQSF